MSPCFVCTLVAVTIVACSCAASPAAAKSSTDSSETPFACMVHTPTVTPVTATIHVGDTLQLTAIVDAGCEPNAVIRWTSTMPTIATVDSVSALVLGVSSGVALIYATDRHDPSDAGAATVTVVP